MKRTGVFAPGSRAVDYHVIACVITGLAMVTALHVFSETFSTVKSAHGGLGSKP